MSGFNIQGLSSGIDWNNYIQSIMQAEAGKLNRTIGRQEVKASATQAVFSQVKGLLQGFNSVVNDFRFSGDFKQTNVTSSDAEVITATSTLSAEVQSIQVEVTQMATLEQHALSFTDTDDAILNSSDTTITITVRGEEHILDVPSGTTLSGLKDIINGENIGVTAAVFDTQEGVNPARLTIQDKTLGAEDDTGVADNITFDIGNLDQVGTAFTETVDAKDTLVTINGIDVRRDGHTITDVIPGVSFQVLKEDPGNAVTLTVTESTKDASDKMKNLVTKYNEVVAGLKKALAFDPNLEVQTNPTAGNSTLRSILTRLQSAVTSEVSTLPESNTIRSLADLGIETSYNEGEAGQNGFLEFDATTFNEVLDEKYDEVIEFFEGVIGESEKLEGFADKVGSVMDSYLNSTDGVLTTKLNTLSAELARLSDEKNAALERLAEKEENLVLRFARLETQLSKLNSQSSQLNSAIQSLNLNNTFIANKSK